MKRFTMLVGVTVVMLTTLRPDAVQGTVVYDNGISGFIENYYGEFVPGLSQVGDEVVLSGSAFSPLSVNARSFHLSEFRFAYSGMGLNPALATVTVFLYGNDGPLVSGVPSPGAPLWTSAPFPIGNTTHNANTTGYVDIVYDQSDFGSLLVPKHLTWAVQFAGFTPSATCYAGLLTEGPPETGLNYDTYWGKDILTGVWTLLQQGNSGPPDTRTPMSFGASFSADYTVPDSTVFWDLPLSAMLVLIIGGAIKRRRQSSVALVGVV